MQIDFQIDGKPVQYVRDQILGSSELRTPEGNIEIDSALAVGTHFSFRLKKEKTVQLYGHSVTIEKVRPLLFAGFRPSNYRILVDGELRAEQSGY